MPSIASFFENCDGPGDEDDGKSAECAATDDTSAVCSVDDASGDSVAKRQCDVVIGENAIEEGTVDLRIASEVLGETSTKNAACIIGSELCEPVIG